MIRELVTAGHTYRVRDAGRFRAAALLVVELSAATRAIGVGAVHALQAHTATHLTDDTWLVVTGDPDVVCPDLATTPFDLAVDLTVAGRPARLTFTIPAGAALPHRPPSVDVAGPAIALTGTVRRRAFPHSPVVGATVTVAGTHPFGHLLAVRTPLAAAHAVGTPVRPRTLALGGAYAVDAHAPSGATSIVLNAVGGLSAGDRIALDHGEVVHIDAVDAATDTVQVRLPIQRTLPAGTVVREAVIGPPAVGTTLTCAAGPGDGVLVAAVAVGGALVELFDPPTSELRALGAVTGAAGTYRLAGVRGLTRIDVAVDATGFTTFGPQSHSIDPRRDPTVIDAELTV